MALCKEFLKTIHNSKIEMDELGKAKQFALFSIKRPHMRSFHASWFCFFMAFLSWFGIQPLLPSIRKELKLSKVDLANSGIASVAGPILVTVIAGPLCDKFGPRRSMSILLISGAIPMILTGVIKDGIGLILVRLFIGILGATFVPGQLWAGAMFNPFIVGTANGLVGGWGNLGGGCAFLLMPGLFQLIQVCGADEFLAWKIAVVIPSGICVLLGISILCTTDDCPQGDWCDRKFPETILHVAEIKVESNGVSNLGFDSTLENDPVDRINANEDKEPREINYNIDRKLSAIPKYLTETDSTGKNSFRGRSRTSSESSVIIGQGGRKFSVVSVPQDTGVLNDIINGIDNRKLSISEKDQREINDNVDRKLSLTTQYPTDINSTGLMRQTSLETDPTDKYAFEGRDRSSSQTSSVIIGRGGRKFSVISNHDIGVLKDLKLDMPSSQKNDENKQTMADRFWAIMTVVILTVHYGMCFGVELAVNTVINLYFLYRFKKEGCGEGLQSNMTNMTMTNMTTPMPEDLEDLNPCSILSQDTASLISSLFGLMNLFARALGGIYSDVLRKFFNLPGRLIAHCTALVGQGVMLVIFSQLDSVSAAIGTLVIFSTFVQISEGTTFAITPYVSQTHVGTVAGIVGAGGNAGAIIWNVMWVEYVETDPSGWFWVLGIIVLIGSGLSVFLVIQKQRMHNLFTQCASCNNDKYEVNNVTK